MGCHGGVGGRSGRRRGYIARSRAWAAARGREAAVRKDNRQAGEQRAVGMNGGERASPGQKGEGGRGAAWGLVQCCCGGGSKEWGVARDPAPLQASICRRSLGGTGGKKRAKGQRRRRLVSGTQPRGAGRAAAENNKRRWGGLYCGMANWSAAGVEDDGSKTRERMVMQWGVAPRRGSDGGGRPCRVVGARINREEPPTPYGKTAWRQPAPAYGHIGFVVPRARCWDCCDSCCGRRGCRATGSIVCIGRQLLGPPKGWARQAAARLAAALAAPASRGITGRPQTGPARQPPAAAALRR